MPCLVSIEKKGIRQFTNTKLLETFQYDIIKKKIEMSYSDRRQINCNKNVDIKFSAHDMFLE